MPEKNLEEMLKTRNPVEMLRNSQIGAYIYPVVPPEFTNWRDEQAAWRKTAVLFDQSHHMAEMMVTGPDAFKFMNYLTINSFANFPVNRAKQFVPCSHDGYVIGDGIIFHLGENQLNFVGRAPNVDWIQFHGESGKFNIKMERDDRSPSRPGGKPVTRRHYRYQVQGPNAWKILEKLNGGTIPEVKFFTMDTINIAGRKVRCLRHGMAGAPGLEVWGPYAEGDEIRAAILEAGKEFGIVPVGSRAYATNTLESGWIPSPLPAIYTGEKQKPFREWSKPNSYVATGSIAGSFVSSNIEDYYSTPYEMGYGGFVKFDHDFIGREALEKNEGQAASAQSHFRMGHRRRRENLPLLLRPGSRELQIHRSAAVELRLGFVRCGQEGQQDRRPVDVQRHDLERTRQMLSLGVVDPDIKQGDVLTLVWGEENGGTKKTTVERHKQTEIRVTVAPVPYAREVRESYGGGWRLKQTA